MSPRERFAIGLSDVHAAQERIQDHIIRTPLLASESLSRRLGCGVHFKAENLQHCGAFKVRGATNAVLAMSGADALAGVVTHSSGNHAAAIARAASIRGIAAHVVMPHNAAKKKIAAVRAFGVEPVYCEPTTRQREAAAEQLRFQTGAKLVHPFESPEVIAGQATVGLEILSQLESVDDILVPVGGGGLLAGVLTAVKSLRPNVKVYAVEPEWADDTARSLQAGCPQDPTRYDTVADGLRTRVGDNTFPIIQSFVDDLLLVSEESILAAMRLIAEQAHLVAEPSGAVATAGLVCNQSRFQGRNVAIVISGGNADLKLLESPD